MTLAGKMRIPSCEPTNRQVFATETEYEDAQQKQETPTASGRAQVSG